MSLRIVHVLDSLRLGGTETQSVALVRGLAARGVLSHVVYFQPGPLRPLLDLPGVTVERMEVHGFLSRGFPGLVVRLARAMRACRADVVQSYGFYTNAPAILAGRLAGVPAVVASRRGFASHLRPAQRRADGFVRRFADRTVVNAEAIRAQLVEEERVAPGRVVVIPNCVLERGAVTPAQDPVVGMVANFRAPKDHATFLRAAAVVADTVPTAEFHLVGAGPDEPGIRRLADELGLAARVRFLGCLPPDAVWDALNRFAVAVLSSLSEGMPNAVLEAMMAARPVVATAVGGVPEVVRDGVTGYLVAPRDVGGLAEPIGRLLKDPELAARMGAVGRRHVLTTYGAEQMVDRFLGLYAGLGTSRAAA